MASIARRREAKAARRKQQLAERQKLAVGDAAAAIRRRAQHLAQAPLHCCLVHDGLFERGSGVVIVARRTGASLTFAVVLVDTYCLGVKDVIFREGSASEFEAVTAALQQEAPLSKVEPAYARKLLRDAAAYGKSLGFNLPRDYAAADLLFGDRSADACDVTFHFGREGKPFYIPGATETPAQVRQRLDHLRRRFGEDGFDFALSADDPEDGEWSDDASSYDPAEAPEPTEWLELDEQERLDLILDYHSSAGINLTDEQLYAHAALHAVIENQAAIGDELPVRRAIERLIKEGLDRHDAVHAVASVLAERLTELVAGEDAGPVQAAYNAAVEQLTADGWRRTYADKP